MESASTDCEGMLRRPAGWICVARLRLVILSPALADGLETDMRIWGLGLGLLCAACTHAPVQAPTPLRVATWNVSFYGEPPLGLKARMDANDPKIAAVARVIQQVRPDILLLNEFDYDPEGTLARRFVQQWLGQPQGDAQPVDYPYQFQAEVNTGVPSGMDLDGDGRSDGPGDAWGFGQYPGQYGLLVLSRYPIDRAAVRSFRLLRWAEMPGALAPQLPGADQPWYPAAVWSQLRLSSKSHWDVPVETPYGPLHFLVQHPTPPVFDGPEDRNGRRNHDEIRMVADYVHPDPARAAYLRDDAGRSGGLSPAAAFVVAGDLNADPLDGAAWPGTMDQLLQHPRIRATPVPVSAAGARAWAAQPDRPALRGDPARHTSSFGLRVDYVLPSLDWQIMASAVHWPDDAAAAAAVEAASDHRMVWVDLLPAAQKR